MVDAFEKNIHPIATPTEKDRLLSLLDDFGLDIVIKAIDRAVIRGNRNLGYITGILNNWQQNGYDDEQSHKNTPSDADADRREILKAYAERKRSNDSKPFAGFLS